MQISCNLLAFPKLNRLILFMCSEDRLSRRIMATRDQICNAYSQKAEESLIAARECLRNGHYRATCNRAWYAIMQIVTAAMYRRTSDIPSNGKRINWKHERCCENFRILVTECAGFRASSLKKQFAARIPMLLDFRNVSDYKVPPDNAEISIDSASQAVTTAGQIVSTVRAWL